MEGARHGRRRAKKKPATTEGARARSLRAITPQEAKASMVIKMRIEEASAKVRDAGVGDEDEDLGLPIWAGVIPVETVLRAAGHLTDGPRLRLYRTEADALRAAPTWQGA